MLNHNSNCPLPFADAESFWFTADKATVAGSDEPFRDESPAIQRFVPIELTP